eukprot:CAMPEP_0194327606 /NCGR_PEP_ID=MMETSP0171-20130528/41827_1 /TAXON_ID=218684 /ORGANISM="Corethron pennatum, Strain L29A3" /LENGTH=187 /DNA_ID=CAMNT_0039087623 /DNA_START=74 /DNA_END=633 /DNA_ORIENTATION=+
MMDLPGRDINTLLEKITNYDKDERYMATMDLGALLSRAGSGGPPVDTNTERRAAAAILGRLDDPSNDVQSVAVKTLSALFVRVGPGLAGDAAHKLSDSVTDASRPELRDVYAIGLRSLVKDVPEACGPAVCGAAVRALLRGLASDDDGMRAACCDVFTDILGRFGSCGDVAEAAGEIGDACLGIVRG